MLPLAQIEQAIKDAVQALNRPYIAEIKTYAGEFDFSDDREFAQVVQRFPAVWTTFDGSGKPERLSARRYTVPLTFSVIVGARSIRSEESARHGASLGTGVDVGSFTLVNDVLAAVLGRSFSIAGLRPFELGALRTIFNTKTQGEAVSVLAQSFTTECTLVVPDADAAADAQYIERVSIDYMQDARVLAGDVVELAR